MKDHVTIFQNGAIFLNSTLVGQVLSADLMPRDKTKPVRIQRCRIKMGSFLPQWDDRLDIVPGPVYVPGKHSWQINPAFIEAVSNLVKNDRRMNTHNRIREDRP